MECLERVTRPRGGRTATFLRQAWGEQQQQQRKPGQAQKVLPEEVRLAQAKSGLGQEELLTREHRCTMYQPGCPIHSRPAAGAFTISFSISVGQHLGQLSPRE